MPRDYPWWTFALFLVIGWIGGGVSATISDDEPEVRIVKLQPGETSCMEVRR
jgi:hypothetical protein